MESSEQQLIVIPAKNYTVYVTDKRLLFVKVSGQSTGSILGGAIGGAIGSLIGDAVE